MANPSFEADVLADTVFTVTPTGWTVGIGGKGGAFNPGPAQAVATDGVNVGYSSRLNSPLSQTLSSVTVKEGWTYVMKVDVIARIDLAFPGYTVALRLNGVNVPAATAVGTSGSVAPGASVTKTVSFTATAAQANQSLSVFLSSNALQTDFDNVRVWEMPAACLATFSP